MKRENVITWDEYFMGLAKLSAMRSKDPRTQVGACIVDENKRIVSLGYNGFPKRCSDDIYPWENEGDTLNVKYTYVVHAEMNAILNAKRDLSNCTLYVTLFPCNECAKAIIQSGIKRVYYEDDKYAYQDATKASKKMLATAGVDIRQYKSNNIDNPKAIKKTITLEL